jgi:hypothetical protein
MHRFSHLPPEEAWAKMVNDHILTFGGKVSTADDNLAQVCTPGLVCMQ